MAVRPGDSNRRNSVSVEQADQSSASPPRNDLEVVERVTETLKPLLKNPSEVQNVVTRVVSIAESYSGPTPHPEHLERIELIAPGSAREIIGMALAEQKFRHRIELLTVLYPYLGLVSGFLIAIICFYLAYLLGMAGHPEVASGFIGVSAVGVVGWFIKSRLSDKDENDSSTQQKQKNNRNQTRRR